MEPGDLLFGCKAWHMVATAPIFGAYNLTRRRSQMPSGGIPRHYRLAIEAAFSERGGWH
jgi:hypothetical protein